MLRAWTALALAASLFLGTLFAIDLSNPAKAGNRIRAEHIRLLMAALETYHRVHGNYPELRDNPVSDLEADLVGGGFIKSIPQDPLRQSEGLQYRYVSDGKIYGIMALFKEEPFLTGKREGGPCVSGVGIKGSGAWGDPRECPL
jgi:hypothetical protein